MEVHITGSSGILLWRIASDSAVWRPAFVSHPLTDCPADVESLASLALANGAYGPMPVHMMVPREDLRISRRLYRYTVFSGKLSERAFCQVAEHVRVASPELCIVEYARRASRARLLELCFEFCGFYALDRREHRGFRSRRAQLCTVQSLLEFVRRNPGLPGSRKVSAVLRYVKEGSRSPMETRVYMLACLPRQFGGYGLPFAKLNMRIELDQDDKAYSGRRFFECDICWPFEKVVIEYDGHADHESKRDRARDATKRNVLLSRGYSVFTLTGEQVCREQTFDRAMHAVAAALNYKIKSLPPGWAQRRSALREELFMSIPGFIGEASFPK